MFINQSLNKHLKSFLEKDDKIILLGEDIHSPYGGAFKVTKNLSNIYPDRVITTPISEAGIVGSSIGLSMVGYKPIVEIMFGDFLLLAADQIINHLSKFYFLHNDLRPSHIVIRTPMGGRRGYGPTHSQSLEKHFMGVPGLDVIALNIFVDSGELLTQSISSGNPVLFIENKKLYSHTNNFHNTKEDSKLVSSNETFPVHSYIPQKNNSIDFTIATYGGMSLVCYEVVNYLYDKYNINGELIVSSKLTQPNLNPIIKSIKKTKIFITVEENVVQLGFGSELISNLHDIVEFRSLKIGSKNYIIPSAPKLENKILPTKSSVINEIINFLNQIL